MRTKITDDGSETSHRREVEELLLKEAPASERNIVAGIDPLDLYAAISACGHLFRRLVREGRPLWCSDGSVFLTFPNGKSTAISRSEVERDVRQYLADGGSKAAQERSSEIITWITRVIRRVPRLFAHVSAHIVCEAPRYVGVTFRALPPEESAPDADRWASSAVHSLALEALEDLETKFRQTQYWLNEMQAIAEAASVDMTLWKGRAERAEAQLAALKEACQLDFDEKRASTDPADPLRPKHGQGRIAKALTDLSTAADVFVAQKQREALESARGLDTSERVRFYEHDFYPLSNFSAFPIRWPVNGSDAYDAPFLTSEHVYHWEKLRYSDNDAARRIRTGGLSAHEAFKIGQTGKRRKDWDFVKVDVMREILRAKVRQHEYVKRKLLETGNRELVEDSWRDDFWGWGPERTGKNMLGKLWMEIRSEIRKDEETKRK